MNISHQYWKHENCMDVFFEPISTSIIDGEEYASGYWLTQGTSSYWIVALSKYVIIDKIKITRENADKWHPYKPFGVER